MEHHRLEKDKIVKSVSDKQYVSFDIFDTLILRPYVRPTDLFRHIEKITGRTGFADLRHNAEMNVRRRFGREIKLKEIYDEIPGNLDLMQTEVDLEIQVAVPNKEITALAKELRNNGKKIILISDMYLPKDIIEMILDNIGFREYDELFVSSEFGVSKHTGELYDIVLEQLKISPDDVFHIGDNRHSDHDVPEKKNIGTYLYRKPLDVYRSIHKDEYRVYKRNRSLDNSILVGMDIIRGTDCDDIWYETGYRFGGPLANAYSLFIKNNLKKNQTVLFASRDGYNLKRIFDSVFNMGRTHYAYVQRLIMDVLTDHKIGYGITDLPNRNSDRYGYESTVNAMSHIISFFSDELHIEQRIERDDIPKFYKDNIPMIDGLRKNGLSRYKEYLTDMCQNNDVCLVDCTTMKYSSQKLVETVIGRKIGGCYLVTIEDNKEYSYNAMHKKEGLMIGWSNINIPEFFLSSPELPLTGWKDGPVQDDAHECEQFRSSIYGKVSDGEVDYARDFHKVFGEYGFPLDYESVVKWSKLSSVRGTKSCEALKKIKWASDPDHSQYQSLILDGKTLLFYMKNMIVTVISKLNR